MLLTTPFFRQKTDVKGGATTTTASSAFEVNIQIDHQSVQMELIGFHFFHQSGEGGS